MQIPDSIILILAAIGFMHISVYTLTIARYTLHYFKFSSFPKTIEEETITLLRGRIADQSKKIETLEKETEKMTMGLLKHLT